MFRWFWFVGSVYFSGSACLGLVIIAVGYVHDDYLVYVDALLIGLSLVFVVIWCSFSLRVGLGLRFWGGLY